MYNVLLKQFLPNVVTTLSRRLGSAASGAILAIGATAEVANMTAVVVTSAVPLLWDVAVSNLSRRNLLNSQLK